MGFIFGQHEINFLFSDVLRAADNHVIYKNAAKEMAAQDGKAITFMAKYDEREGNSCHIHLSVRGEDGTPVFAEPTRPHVMAASGPVHDGPANPSRSPACRCGRGAQEPGAGWACSAGRTHDAWIDAITRGANAPCCSPAAIGVAEHDRGKVQPICAKHRSTGRWSKRVSTTSNSLVLRDRLL